ncbi:glycosyltransferase [Aliiroseovarius crassostreae]|uniref:glycosyltransferase n=1 Tax=Aliiroseovarius crassostreae TaxID=154981 RepID=UPI003C7E2994
MPRDTRPSPQTQLRISAWPKRKNAAFNPFQALLYDAVEAGGVARVEEFHPRQLLGIRRPDILHIHWPDVFLAAGKGWRFWPRYILLRGLFALAALRRIPIVWTAHNLLREGQRNSSWMGRLFWPWFLRRVDAVLFMTEASKQAAFDVAPDLEQKPHVVIPHGHYGPLIDPERQRPAPATPPRILFFGAITRYKQAHKVLRAFLDLPVGRAGLAIRGKMSGAEPDLELLMQLDRLPAARRGEISFEDRFLEEDELVCAIDEATLVVFPYTDVLNSGAAIFALSVGCPVLASDTALFRELQAQIGEGWVRLIDGALDGSQLAQGLAAAETLRKSGETPDLTPFDWSRIAALTVQFYRDVADPASGGPS